MKKEILIVSHLTKRFKVSKKQRKLENSKEKIKIAVNDISFTAYEGEIFGLLGPNGAGKTTTLRMLASMIKADEGDAIIAGNSLKDDVFEVRKSVGFLTSELKMEEFFSPDYLFDFYSQLYKIPSDICKERKKELFELFEINDFAGEKLANLSTGMKQKVSIVISLVHDPEIIIFDEPTNGLDILTAKLVTDYLLELKKRGKTIIISTHIFSLIEKLCDRLGIIVKGNLIECGSLEEICKDEGLEEHFFKLIEENKE